MGGCVSSPAGPTEEEKRLHKEAEKAMRDQKLKLESQVKVRFSFIFYLAPRMTLTPRCSSLDPATQESQPFSR